MRSGTSLPGGSENVSRRGFPAKAAKLGELFKRDGERDSNQQTVQQKQMSIGESNWNLPARVWASAAVKRGEYDARRLRSQREVIRDVMLAAAECDTWLTLGELRRLTSYGEASISAQLRHLRKLENGGYDVSKHRREGANSAADGRGDCVWEYRILRILRAAQEATSLKQQECSGVSHIQS